MKAILMRGYGYSDVLSFESIAVPSIEKNELLIKVHAIGINSYDLNLLSGKFVKDIDVNIPFIFGSDFAGEIIETGYEVTEFRRGDKVYGSGSVLKGGSGALSQYIKVKKNNVSRMPDDTDYIMAASVVTAGCTAQEAINVNINLKPGKKILIHGAGGSVGFLAAQLALSIGAEVAVTVGEKDIKRMKNLGVDLIINYHLQNFEDIIQKYDAVLDTQGGEVLERSYQVLKPGGVLVSLISKPDESELTRNRITGIYQKTTINTLRLNTLSFLIEEKIFVPRLPDTEIFNNAIVAIENKIADGTKGKLVVVVPNN